MDVCDFVFFLWMCLGFSNTDLTLLYDLILVLLTLFHSHFPHEDLIVPL